MPGPPLSTAEFFWVEESTVEVLCGRGRGGEHQSSFWKIVSCKLAFVLVRRRALAQRLRGTEAGNVSVSHSSDHSFTASVATSSHY